MTVSPKLRALFDEDTSPGEVFRDTVREIGRYARVPRRVVTKAPCRGGRHSNGRLLSYREMGDIEERLIEEGLELKPKFSRGGKRMRKNREQIQERMERLYEVIRDLVDEHGFFKMGMLRDSALLRARIAEGQKYFNRTVLEDVRKLVGNGLIYRRGRGLSSAYYLGDGKEGKVEKGKPADEDRAMPGARFYECFGVLHGERDECEGCHYRTHCFDVKSRIDKMRTKEEQQHREPLIPRHVTVDVNVTFRLGMR